MSYDLYDARITRFTHETKQGKDFNMTMILTMKKMYVDEYSFVITCKPLYFHNLACSYDDLTPRYHKSSRTRP